MPLDDRPRACWIVGAAIETMVWSMNVIATAKIIAVKIRLLDRLPAPVVPMAVIVSSQLAANYLVAAKSGIGSDRPHQSNDYDSLPGQRSTFAHARAGVTLLSLESRATGGGITAMCPMTP